MKHSVKAVPVLAAALLFLTGCAQPADPASVTKPDVMTEDVQTDAVTEVPETEPVQETEEPVTHFAHCTDEDQFWDKHAHYENNGGVMVTNAANWQEGYAQLLRSDEAIYLMPNPPSSVYLTFDLFDSGDPMIPDLMIGFSDLSIRFFRYVNGNVIYLDGYGANTNGELLLRPGYGDVGYISLNQDGSEDYVLWHLGDKTPYTTVDPADREFYFDEKPVPLTPEQAEQFGITDYDAATHYGVPDETWSRCGTMLRDINSSSIKSILQQ